MLIKIKNTDLFLSINKIKGQSKLAFNLYNYNLLIIFIINIKPQSKIYIYIKLYIYSGL